MKTKSKTLSSTKASLYNTLEYQEHLAAEKTFQATLNVMIHHFRETIYHP